MQRIQINEKIVSQRLHQQSHGSLDDLCAQQRSHHQTQIMKKSKTSSKIMVPTLQSLIDSSWKNCKKMPRNIETNTVVMAKMKTYCPWPSRIIELNKTRQKAKVYFFGTQNEGVVDIKDIVEFLNAKETVRLLLLRNEPNFTNGVHTIEMILEIPDEFSFFKKSNELLQ